MIDSGRWAGTRVVDPHAAGVLARAEAAVAELVGLDLGALVRLDGPSEDLVAVGAAVEVLRRRLGVFDVGYVAALESGGVPARHGCASTATFLKLQLRLSPGQAKARVALAGACGPREEFGAGVLPAVRPVLAAAMAAGVASSEHAAVVLAALDRLPDTVPVEQVEAAEALLVEQARVFSPAQVATCGRRVLDHLDPDGTLRDQVWQDKVRDGVLVADRHGSGIMRFALTTEALELAQSVLGPLAAPVPAGPDGPDPRSHGQRMHDALVELLRRALTWGDLPASGGTPTTVVIHLTAAQLESRTGLAISEHGNLIPVRTALAMAQDALIYTLVTDARAQPLWLGRTTRFATPAQTIALAARDRGCAHPGCDRPPSQTERHHIKEWVKDRGPTDIVNLILLCAYHHREHDKLGWTIVIIDGHPWWIPPAWIDPEQRPIRNHHHPPLLT